MDTTCNCHFLCCRLFGKYNFIIYLIIAFYLYQLI